MATRRDVIDLIAARNDYLKKEDVTFVVNSVFEQISSALLTEKRVEIRNFGTFSVRKRKFTSESSLRNNPEGKTRDLSVVYYRASQAFGDLIK